MCGHQLRPDATQALEDVLISHDPLQPSCMSRTKARATARCNSNGLLGTRKKKNIETLLHDNKFSPPAWNVPLPEMKEGGYNKRTCDPQPVVEIILFGDHLD